MNKIQVLDCTLRDGGYVNNFHFGRFTIEKIIKQLTLSNIDIIECGFLEDCLYNEDLTLFNSVEQISSFLPIHREGKLYVAMACYGEYSIENMSDYDGTSIEGIRVTFHYNEIEEALDYCQQIKNKGYKVFVQPVGTTSYSDIQLVRLIEKVNQLDPYAFYLVDTLGLMHKEDIIRMFYLVDHNLLSHINLGFHSHNNLQLSYSNCQELVNTKTKRTIFLDASVYGMGRGAGNLNTELIVNFLNEEKSYKYEIEPLLEIIDEFLIHIKMKYEWGYTVSYYLAAVNGCHPSYAAYLSNKQTLPIKSISTVLKMLEPDKRSLFNESIIEEKYLEYQENNIDDRNAKQLLGKFIANKNIIVLAPGASLKRNVIKIKEFAKIKNCLIIAVGFIPDFIECDFAFLSNLKRYQTTFSLKENKVKLIHTSNLKIANEANIIVNYSSLLNEKWVIRDNACLMLLNLISTLNPAKVFIAGFDGYSIKKDNYYSEELNLIQDQESIIEKNSAIQEKLSELTKLLNIKFITESLYENK